MSEPKEVVMDRYEATGAAATAALLRELADEIEHGAVSVKGGEMPVSDAGLSAVVQCPRTTQGGLSVVAVRLVEMRQEARHSDQQDVTGHASELARELAYPGD
jgi:hypothetical protein